MISEHSYLAALVYRCACVIQIHVPSRLCAVTDSMHGLQKMKCSLGETDKKKLPLEFIIVHWFYWIPCHGLIYDAE